MQIIPLDEIKASLTIFFTIQ